MFAFSWMNSTKNGAKIGTMKRKIRLLAREHLMMKWKRSVARCIRTASTKQFTTQNRDSWSTENTSQYAQAVGSVHNSSLYRYTVLIYCTHIIIAKTFLPIICLFSCRARLLWYTKCPVCLALPLSSRKQTHTPPVSSHMHHRFERMKCKTSAK